MIFQPQQTNLLELFLKHKNQKNTTTVSIIDELNLPYKITFAMKPIIEEILKTKEINYCINGATGNNRTTFEILNVNQVLNAYDKYTFISKKEQFYNVVYSVIARIIINEAEKNVILVLKDSSHYQNMFKLSKNLNEYFDTIYNVDPGDLKTDSNIIIKKDVLETSDLKVYKTSHNNSGDKYCFFLHDLTKKIISESKPIRVYFYEHNSDDYYM